MEKHKRPGIEVLHTFLFIAYMFILIGIVGIFLPYQLVIKILVPFFFGTSLIIFGDWLKKERVYELKQMRSYPVVGPRFVLGNTLQYMGLFLVAVSAIRIVFI